MPPPLPPPLSGTGSARATVSGGAAAAGRATLPQAEHQDRQEATQARLGLFDKPPKDEEAHDGGSGDVAEGAEGDPAADAARAEAQVEADAKREGLNVDGDDEVDPNPTGKPRYKRAPLDPVAMGRGVIKTVDNVTMFAYKVGVRDYISRAELEEGVRDMALDKDQVDWAASDLADLFEQIRKTFTPETRVAISSGPLLAMRILDVIDRVIAARDKGKKKTDAKAPAGYPGAAARFQTVPVE
jgi:hypothetical protein